MGNSQLLFSSKIYEWGCNKPDFNVVAHAGAQVKIALMRPSLDGENYVFWGGREGYISLLNTDMGEN